MSDNYLDLDAHIQGNAHALQTGEASLTDRFVVQTGLFKRMKHTQADGAPIWSDCEPHTALDITDEVLAAYRQAQS